MDEFIFSEHQEGSQPTSPTTTFQSTLSKGAVQKSWVWPYFNLSSDHTKVQCQVPEKSKQGDPCNQVLCRGDQSSTTSMIQHLKRIHQIYPPEDESSGQMPNPNLLKRQRGDQRPILTVIMLRQAIAYLIAEADLSYSIVEHPSFINLLELLNPSVANMEYGRQTIANEVSLLYQAHQNQLKESLKAIKHLSFTLDAWTSPNQKAFMAITAQGITEDWKLLDVVVGMPTVHGEHSGENFGNIFVERLNEMGISNSLISITADNASNNSTLARQVQHRLGNSLFAADKQLLGCMAHVINLAAQDGIKAIGGSPSGGKKPEELITMDHSDSQSNRLESRAEPDDYTEGTSGNLQTLLTRIHGVSNYVRNTPQRREAFCTAIDLVNRQTPIRVSSNKKGKKRILNLDVRTQWNSTYKMLRRALDLKLVCIAYCSTQAETAKYSLTRSEWDQVDQIAYFLEPLYVVTKMLL
ncbi:hypothetical protein PSTT_06285 [Puccinia striiformis]|uniref:BED-type domain-containing protein n=1 Tax=Puccinia striiformis TaxID=27350 RepID=A0A2S4VKM0_9BASI|nr:hypothetical protein PSTT_06285 [Puccinia striiformis]